MQDLTLIRENINEMAGLTLSMLETAFAGFMKNDSDALDCVLKEKIRLNVMEKEITSSLVDISRAKITAVEKKNIMFMIHIVTDLDQIGDYIEAIIERIQIKIEENLVFSDDSLDEYKHLYSVVQTELADVEKALRMNDKNFARRILCSTQNHVDNLVAQYRQSHTKRIVAGTCQPRTCNMFSDLLDFTGQISRHTKAVAKNISDLQ